MSTIAMVLPACNEELTIAATMEAFHPALSDARFVVEDNNSSDGTSPVAGKTLQRLHVHGIFLNEPRQRRENAVRRAILDVDADKLCLCRRESRLRG